MRDPYTVLGVSKTASEKEIKSAYRTLAKRWHPDSNKGEASAAEKFAEIGRAYEIIGDKDKRGQYDRGEIDAEGKPRFQGFSGAGPDFGFRGRGPGGQAGAEDIISELFGQAFRGGRSRGFRAEQGPGGFEDMFAGFQQAGPQGRETRVVAEVKVEDLARGKATAFMPSGKTVAFSIPAGAEEGQIVRLAGQGERGGDALVTLRFARHSKFDIDGSDLRMTADLPLEIAVGGGKLAVDTLDGKVALNIPAWTDSGKVFRLKGKGLPARGGGHGDLLVTLAIRLPEKGRSELQQLMKRLA